MNSLRTFSLCRRMKQCFSLPSRDLNNKAFASIWSLLTECTSPVFLNHTCHFCCHPLQNNSYQEQHMINVVELIAIGSSSRYGSSSFSPFTYTAPADIFTVSPGVTDTTLLNATSCFHHQGNLNIITSPCRRL